MPSMIDPNHPAEGTTVSKAASRANWAAAKAEIEALQDTAGAALNVKAAFGAVGDGRADNTAALQAAIDAGLPLWLPPGDYRITAPLTYNSGLVMRGAGATGQAGTPFSRIRGNFAGPLLHRAGIYVDHNDAVVGTVTGTLVHGPVVEDVVFMNHHADGCCFQTYNSLGPVSFVRCKFAFRFRGLLLLQAFDATVLGCQFEADPFASGYTVESHDSYISRAYGLYSGSHTTITGCGFRGCGTAACLIGAESNFVGNRIEVCGYGLRLGGIRLDPETIGQNWLLQRSIVAGISLESNYRNVLLHYVGDAVSIQAIGMQGGTNGPAADGKSLYGVRVAKADGASSFMSEVSASGRFKQACFLFEATIPSRNLEGHNDEPGGATFAGINGMVGKKATGLAYRLDGAPINPAIDGALADIGLWRITAFSDLQLRGLVGLNIAEPHVQANNLGGGIAVPEGQSSVDIAFPGEVSPDDGAFSAEPSPVSDGGSMLQAGTYWYTITTVAKRGETGYDPAPSPTHKSVTVTSGQRVNLNWHGVGAAVKRRLYRGRTPTDFEGFWEFPCSVGSFADDGNTPFTGRDKPPTQGTSVPPGTEPDANYRIVATPSWNTAVWVDNKTTCGFRINFGAAAPQGAECNWLLFRA